MDDIQKKSNQFVALAIFLVVIICATLIVLEMYTNVSSELHAALWVWVG